MKNLNVEIYGYLIAHEMDIEYQSAESVNGPTVKISRDDYTRTFNNVPHMKLAEILNVYMVMQHIMTVVETKYGKEELIIRTGI